MTSDDRLAALFREAAGDPPPSGFDHEGVVTASRRIARRRRSAVLGGAMALLVVAGVGVAVAVPRVDGPGSTAAAPALAPETGPAEGVAPFDAPGDAEAAAPVEPFRADEAAPLGPGTAACADGQDPQLRALLEQVLPEVAGAPEAAVTTQCRPPGERGVSLEVTDGGTTGLLTVRYFPPGAAPDVAHDGASAATASGGTVVAGSRPVGPTGALPFENRLGPVVEFLAPRL